MKFDLLLFDLDGTLIDSELDVTYALNRLLGDYQIDAIDQAIIRHHVGYGIRPLIDKALFERGISDLDGAFSKFTEYYLERCVHETKLYDDVLTTLQNLSGYRKVILTNKSTRFIDKILNGLELKDFFVASYGRESFARSKPDPLPIYSIMQEHGAAPGKSLMIGDTETDILAGGNAGIQTCLVTYGYGREENLAKLNPTYKIPKLSDLIPLLESKASV